MKKIFGLWLTLGCTFYGWGIDFLEFESGPGNYSIGIVEDSDGNVFMPRADNIFFTDKKEQENADRE